MLRNSILIALAIILFTTNIKAEGKDYPLTFVDSLSSSLIKSLSFDKDHNYLYVNGVELHPSVEEQNLYYSLTINDIDVNFVYSNINKNITIRYEKPIEFKLATEVSVTTVNNKVYLTVSDIDGSRDYLGIEQENKINFKSVSLNINNKIKILDAYLDKENNKVIFNNDNYNFDVTLKEVKTIDVLLKGEVAEDKIYAVNDPMNFYDSLNGELSDKKINEYLTKKTINLFNNTYYLSKTVQLKKLMDKWVNISNIANEKESVVTACVNKDAMCEVFEKTAYLIDDYSYKEVQEDTNKLVEGSKETPVNKRIYTSEDLYSEEPISGDNLEVYKQERNVIKEYNNWSEYKEEECIDTNDKKCRYKDFYTKYTYQFIKSEPQYTKWLKANYLLDDPVETTDTQYTLGPYWNCMKYEERINELEVTTCVARDTAVHKMLVQCDGDEYYEKFCMSDKFIATKKEYNLEPLNEKDREFCSKCLAKRTQSVSKDSNGNQYANFSISGYIVRVDLPTGNCVETKTEKYIEVTNGLCQLMELKYDLYLRDYLGDIDYYEEIPIVEEGIDECVEKTSKEEGRIECSKTTKTSYSEPEIRYSEWKDVNEFSNLENTEKRYRYRAFVTNGIKVVDNKIWKGEYNEASIKNLLDSIAGEQTKLFYTNTTDQYAILETYTKTEDFNSNKNNKNLALKNEKIFAPVIHVLGNEINQLETISYPQYVGYKKIGESSIFTKEDVEELLTFPEPEEHKTKIVFFNKSDTSKIENSDNWKGEEELLKTIKNSDNNNPKYEITITKEELKELNKWVSRKDNKNKNNCELIREFSNIITEPKNFNEMLLRTSGCEI